MKMFVAILTVIVTTGAALAAHATAGSGRVPVAPPEAVSDPSLDAFRAELGAVAAARNLKQLEPLVGPAFFWERDFGGGHDSAASPLQNLTTALSLDDAALDPEYQGIGWRRLAEIAASPLFVQGVHGEDGSVNAACGPAAPSYAEGAVPDELTWGYVLGRVEARAKPSDDAAAAGTLENEAVEIIEPASEELGTDFAKVKLPNGKEAYVPGDALHGFLEDQLCVKRLESGWQIVGYVGGGD